MPSGATRYADGSVPPDLVARNGGHVNANHLLAKKLDQPSPTTILVDPDTGASRIVPNNPTENVGFTVLSRGDGSLEAQFYSHGINDMNPAIRGPLVPAHMRPQVAESISTTTGRPVRYRLYGR
ncbi:MAG TPA: hypothetical protein VIL36_14685 [Acidimicrobiales bacterium]